MDREKRKLIRDTLKEFWMDPDTGMPVAAKVLKQHVDGVIFKRKLHAHNMRVLTGRVPPSPPTIEDYTMTDDNILIGVDYGLGLDVGVEYIMQKLEDGTFKILNIKEVKRDDPR